MASKFDPQELGSNELQLPGAPTAPAPTKAKPDRQRFPPKNKKFPRGPQGGAHKRGPVAYEKKDIPSSLSIPARRRYFPTYVSNLGIRSIVAKVYSAIRLKDHRLAANITEAQMRYVVSVAWYNRLVQVAEQLGYCLGVESASVLRKAAKGIQLPEVVCQYIESLGEVSTNSSVNFVPLCYRTFDGFCPAVDEPIEADESEGDDSGPSRKRLRQDEYVPLPLRQWYHDHRQDLIDAGRPVPGNHWAIDYDWIQNWNDASSRGTFRGISFRRVDLASMTGKEVLLVSHSPGSDQDSLRSFAPQPVLNATAELGCVYRNRNYDDYMNWPGENRQLVFNAFAGPESVPTTTLNDLIVASFTQRGMDESV
jgi:hypothetical protein